MAGHVVVPASAFHLTQDPISGTEVSPCLGVTSSEMGVLAFQDSQSETRVADTIGTIDANYGPRRRMGVVCATGHVTDRGTPIVPALRTPGGSMAEVSTEVPALRTPGGGSSHPIVVAPTLAMGAHTAGPGSNGQDAAQWAETLMAAGVNRPRRLTPRECERLMSWPDDSTRYGINEKGDTYALSDTARYRLCGNGCGSIVTEWIGRRLMAMESA